MFPIDTEPTFYQPATCRTDCGYQSITESQCVASGCGYDSSVPGQSPWCFHSSKWRECALKDVTSSATSIKPSSKNMKGRRHNTNENSTYTYTHPDHQDYAISTKGDILVGTISTNVHKYIYEYTLTSYQILSKKGNKLFT